MKRQREADYRRRLRAEVRGILGNRCAMEDAECSGELEIDHTAIPSWPSFSDPRARWRRLRTEARRGRIRLLCVTHLHLWIKHQKECQ